MNADEMIDEVKKLKNKRVQCQQSISSLHVSPVLFCFLASAKKTLRVWSIDCLNVCGKHSYLTVLIHDSQTNKQKEEEEEGQIEKQPLSD